MLIIQTDGVIKLTRGDTAYLTIDILNEVTGEPYVMNPDDTLTLTVKHSVNDADICFQKDVQGTLDIKINPEDTADCAFDKYVYDVQLTQANGDVYTVVVPTPFYILEEVTC